MNPKILNPILHPKPQGESKDKKHDGGKSGKHGKDPTGVNFFRGVPEGKGLRGNTAGAGQTPMDKVGGLWGNENQNTRS